MLLGRTRFAALLRVVGLSASPVEYGWQATQDPRVFARRASELQPYGYISFLYTILSNSFPSTFPAGSATSVQQHPLVRFCSTQQRDYRPPPRPRGRRRTVRGLAGLKLPQTQAADSRSTLYTYRTIARPPFQGLHTGQQPALALPARPRMLPHAAGNGRAVSCTRVFQIRGIFQNITLPLFRSKVADCS